MNGMRKFILLTVIALIGLTGPGVATIGPALAQEHVERSAAFIETLSADTIALLANDALSEEEMSDRFHNLFLERFAVNRIARFLLGRYRRNASAEELQEYVALVREVTINQWASLISDNFAGQTLEVQQAINVDTRDSGQAAAVVRTEIRDDGTLLARVDWIVASVGDVYKITNVTVAGVSLLTTNRDEYEQVLRSNDGSLAALNALLRDRRDAMVSGN